MRVSEIMSCPSILVSECCTVQEAARRMRQHVIGALPVVEGGRLVGIVTSHDLVLQVISRGLLPGEVYVREVMTMSPAICHPDDSVETAAESMIRSGVRHLIVVDEAGLVAGMLSVEDLALLDQTRALALPVLRELATARRNRAGAPYPHAREDAHKPVG